MADVRLLLFVTLLSFAVLSALGSPVIYSQDSLSIYNINKGKFHVKDDSPPLNTDAECYLCKFFVEKIIHYMEGASIAGKLNTTIDDACMSTFKTKSLCDKLTKMIVDELESFLESQMEPQQACTKAKYCKDSVVAELLDEMYVPLANPEVGGPICDFCQDIVNVVDVEIGTITNLIRPIIDTICRQLPAPTDQKCLNTVDRFIVKFLHMIEVMFSPEKVCTAIHFCKA